MAARKHHIGTNVRGEAIQLSGRSKRSYEMEMHKWNRVYEKEIHARNAIGAGARETGWSDDMFKAQRVHEEKMRAALAEMDRVHREAKDAGHWVSVGWHKHHHSSYAKLVSENRD